MSGNAKKTKKLIERDTIKKEIRDTVGDRLGDLLDKGSNDFRMTAATLAKEANISVGIISGYRNNKNAPSVAHLKSMAEALKVTSDYLLGLSDIPSGSADDMAIEKRLGLSGESIDFLTKLNVDNNNGWMTTPHLEFSAGMKLKALNYILSNEYAGSFLLDIACCIWSDFDEVADDIREDYNGELVCVEGDNLVRIKDKISGGTYIFLPKQLISTILVNIQQTIMHWRAQEGTGNQTEGGADDGEHN